MDPPKGSRMSDLASNKAGGKFYPGEGDDNSSSKPVQATRRSKRQPKPIKREKSLSDDDDDEDGAANKRPRKNPPKRIPTRRVIGPIDSEGKPFCCDRCQSPYVIDPKKSSKSVPKKIPGPRYKVDPETGKRLKLCNACGLAFDRNQRRPQRPKPKPPTEADKKEYAEAAEKFANSLVEGLGDPDAARLSCPHFGQKACACIQRYVLEEGDMEDSRQKANGLLRILKEAKKLKDKKCYNVDEVISRGKKHRKVGLGNGQKKSKEFEEFVLNNRKYLRDDLKLCERATQRILMYSNNFLHKKLKTEPERTRRIERTRGQAALGLLKDIDELPSEKCCDDCCVLLAKTHSVLLNQWRDRAISGQAEARKVLAEMLTPSGLHSNCYKFINLITGCSVSTITRVGEQMKKTGGDREPPPHGLCKYWEDNPRRQMKLVSANDIPSYRAPPSQLPVPVSLTVTRSPTSPESTTTLTQAQLKEQQAHLKRLQQQLEEKQRLVTEQQNLVERQLLQCKLASQQKQKKQQEEQQLRLQEQVLQQTQLQEQQEQQQQLEEQQQQQQQQQQVPEPQAIITQHQEPSPQPTAAVVTQSPTLPITLAATTTQNLPAIFPAALSTSVEGLNPQMLQQNMQTLLSEIASQIMQQQQNMQQLLIEMQNELTAQQIQQLSNLATSNANPTPATNVNNTITSQPPPSYPVAVALNAVNANSQQVQATSATTGGVNPTVSSTAGNQQGPHVIIQAIPTLQQNVLLGNATLTSQLLNAGVSETQDQTQQDASAGATNVQLQGQSYPQQILVSLAPSLNQDTLTTSALAQGNLTQDALNSTEIVEIQFQDVPPPNQEVVPQDRVTQDRQAPNDSNDAFSQQIRLAGLNFGNQELRAALGGTLSTISQPQTFTTTTTRNRPVRIPTLDSSADLSGDAARQTISLLQQGTEASGTVAANQQLPVETLLSPEAFFGSTVNQNLILQPILSSAVSKQNTVQTSQ